MDISQLWGTAGVILDRAGNYMALPVGERHRVERIIKHLGNMDTRCYAQMVESEGKCNENTGTPLGFIRNALKLAPVFYINSRIKDILQ
jgi:hypothetical protein